MSTMTIDTDPRLADLAETFDFLDDWESRFRHVIDLGKALPPLADSERVDAAKVRGCASQVWLVSAQNGQTGTITFRGQSDAAIVQGLLAVLLELYSGRPPQEIVALDPAQALARLGFLEALTPQRSNGLKSMATRIQEVAQDALAASRV
jgi:cysteine desulfuration protein SufE